MPVNWNAIKEVSEPPLENGPSLSVTESIPDSPPPPPDGEFHASLGRNPVRVNKQTPVTDDLMADPAFAAAVKEHAAKLRAVEHQAQGQDPNDFLGHTAMAFKNSKDAVEDIVTDIKGSFLSARNSSELLDLRAKQVLGTASDSEAARADYLSAQRKPWVSPNSVDGFVKGIPGAVAGMVGSMTADDTVGGQILLGAGLGALVTKSPQGIVAGAGAGFLSSSAYVMGKTAMGEFYDRMLRVKTPDGKPMDPGVARGTALAVGALNGALGVLPLGAVLSKTGLGNALLGAGAARWLTVAAGLPEGAAVFARIATQFAAGGGAQAIVGGLQELTSIMGEHAVMLQADPMAYGQSWQASPAADDEMTRIKAAAKGGGQIGVGIGFLEAALHRGGESVALHDNLGEVATKVFEQDRAKAKIWADKVQMEHGLGNVTVPREKLAKLLQEVGLEGDDLKAAMPEVHEQMTNTEGDAKAAISLSLGDMTGYITPTKGWKALRGDLRDGPGNLTLNELRKLGKTINTDTEALSPGAGLKPELKGIFDDVYGQLSKTKVGAPAAEKAATLWTSTVNSVAEATGRSPKEVHAEFKPVFSEIPEAAMDERAAGVPGATVSDTGKYKVMELDKPVAKDQLEYLDELRNAMDPKKPAREGGSAAPEDVIKRDGTYGELFARLSKTTGSPTDAARVLGMQGWDGIDTGTTKRIWRPDAVLPKSDPLKVTRGMTEFEPGKVRISFSEHANVGTIIHEMAHTFLRMWHAADLAPETSVKGAEARAATLAAVERLNAQFKQEHTARADEFAKAQKAEADKYAAGKKKAAPIERKLDSEKFQQATGAEGAAEGDTSVMDTSEMEARLRRERQAAAQVEREGKTRDKNFEADQAAKEEEFLNKQDELENAHDSRMAALKAGVKPKTVTKNNQMADTVNTLLKWLGSDASGGLTPKGEEKFARAFVQYLREGEAPSIPLRPVFDSYKSWLTAIYGTETAMGAPLSPEMRQVFDKLIASQRAIDYAKKNVGEPLFDKKPASMTDAQFEKYKRDMSDLTATAQSQIEKEIFSHMSKEGIDAFERQKAAVRDQLIATDSTHSLVSYLKTGERLDSGPIPLLGYTDSMETDPSSIMHKLDTDKLKSMGLGEDAMRQLQDYHEKGGLDPALVARVFGRDDAHEMVSALKSYIPLDQAVSNEAASRMPGWVDPASWLRARAVDKFSGDVVPKMLWAEFRAMDGKLADNAIGNYNMIRDAAQNALRKRLVASLDPGHFLQEFHRLADEVLKAQRDQIASGMELGTLVGKAKTESALRIERGDERENDKTAEDKPLGQLLADKHGGTKEEWDARLNKKSEGEEAGLSPQELQRRRMVAFESWKFARQVKEDAAKVNGLLDKMRNDDKMRKDIYDNIDPVHVKAFDSAAEAYGFFKPETPTDLPIGEYVKQQVRKGADITEDPELANRAEARTPIGQLSVTQLRHAQDFLESLYHYVTQDVGKFDAGTSSKPLEPLVARLAKGIRDNFDKVNKLDPSRVRGMIASSTTPEHIFRLLDGDIHGDLAKVTIEPIEQGKAKNDAMSLAHDEVMRPAVKSINDGSLVGDSTLRVRDFETTDRITGRKVASKGRLLTKTELVAAVANYGSALNRKALLEGYGITHDEFMAAVQHDLSAKHIEAIDTFWAEHDKYFPDVAETYAKRQGLTLEKVKAIPFDVEFADGTKATATGGYVPIKMSAAARNLRDRQSVTYNVPSDAMEIRDDMTKERQGSTGAVELNLGRVLSSVDAKIHYATMAEPIAQVSKILLHPEIQKAIESTLGPEYNTALFKWLRDKARDGAPLQPLGDWDKAYRWLLSGVSQASVGFNHLTAIKQLPFALSQASSKVGYGNMAKAIGSTLADWKGTWEKALSESAVLRRFNDDPNLLGQLTPFDPEISVPLATKLQQIGHGQLFKTASDVRAYLSELGMAHQNNVRQIGAVFAYEAAKLKAIELGRPDVTTYAEAVVRQAVGGGDSSSFLSEPGMARGTVMLYSHMSLIASELLSSATNLKKNFGKPELLAMAGSLLGFLAIPALSTAVISDDLKDMPDPKTQPDKFASTMLRWEILGHGLGRATPIFGDSIEQFFAYDKPQNRIAGGPIGQATAAARSITQAVTSPRKNLSDAVPAIMAATSIIAHVPTNHIYKDMDLLEGVLSGRYGQNAIKWYDIMAHGPKKEGFK